MAILHAAQSNLSKVNDPFSSQKLQESCDSAVVPTTKGKCSSMIWSIVHPYQIPNALVLYRFFPFLTPVLYFTNAH